ncbi:MAG TPA: class I SAM-dependent methyltransferase [Limnobacter sp.]|nr:class I SAM-dependent methyltransferase [Limnobacter sp.]
MLKTLLTSGIPAARISPTALYTGQVWQHSGRSIPELKSLPASALHLALAPSMFFSKSLGGPTLEDFLLARHDLIDHHLSGLIESGRVEQVIEIAAGLSPRGSLYMERYGEKITYIEADLPAMVVQKKGLLAERLRRTPNHQVVEIDAFKEHGPGSLDSIVGQLDTSKGLAIITEGLLNYFDTPAVLGLWRRIAENLKRFSHGAYLSDIHMKAQNSDPLAQMFVAGLGFFVRGRVHLHFSDADELQQAMFGFGMQCNVMVPSAHADLLPSCAGKGADFCRVLHAQPVAAVK